MPKTRIKVPAKRTPRGMALVVGIGASAGGLAALKIMLPVLPRGKGVAYLLTQHLDPTHPSLLDQLLRRLTPLNIQTAQDGDRLKSDHLYITPSTADCIVVNGKVRLVEIDASGPRHSVDVQLASIAANYGKRCAGIILSGTGSDGLRGMHSIKAAGGVCLVEDPATAQYSGMPQAMIDAHLADLIAPAEQLGAEIERVLSWLGKQEPRDSKLPQSAFKDLVARLMGKTGFPFDQYTDTALLRHAHRRMVVNDLTTLADYTRLIGDSDSEAQRYLTSTLISVTNFFRDPPAFAALAKVLGRIAARHRGGEPIRIWVAGCATGEEAFSVAILLAEALDKAALRAPVQIFATDADESAVTFARRGHYLKTDAARVPVSFLEKYFDVKNSTYQVKKVIRDMIIFARHNLLQDPPFRRLDLITCRNVLIYLKHPAQQRIIRHFSQALNPGGYLALGASERLGAAKELFVGGDASNKLFVRGQDPGVAASVVAHRGHVPGATPLARGMKPNDSSQDILNDALLNSYSPPAVLVGADDRVMHIHGDVKPFLMLQPGKLNVGVMGLIDTACRLDARLALKKCQRERTTVRSQPLKLTRADSPQLLTLVAIPADTVDSPGLTLLVFETRPATLRLSETDNGANDQTRWQAIEEELVATRDRLQSNIEELELANEVLQSTNEEFLSSTEELQSTSEEFETTTEELQSTNEELATVNEELRTTAQELETANGHLEGILNESSSAMLVLDGELRLSRMSPSSKTLLGLSPDSLSQSFPTSGRRDLAPLQADLSRFRKSLELVERELEIDGRLYLVRMAALGLSGASTTSIIVTFIDQTERLTAGREANRLAAVLQDSRDAVILQGIDGEILAWNQGAERMYGYTEPEALALQVSNLIPPANLADATMAIRSVFKRGKRSHTYESTRRHKSGRTFDVLATVTALRSEGDNRQVVAVTERDLTEHQETAERLRTADLTNVWRVHAIGELAAGVAHDLSQPLTAISNSCDAALTRVKTHHDDDPRLVGFLEQAHDQAQRAGSIIRTLTDFVRTRAFEPKAVDLNALIEKTLRLTIHERNAGRVRLILSQDRPLAAVLLDPLQIDKVLINLERNSLEAMQRANSPARELRVSTRAFDSQSVIVTFRDSGPGFGTMTHEDIFRRFVTSKPDGLGLGLSISRFIIESHGGRIWAESDGPTGAVMNFTLPFDTA